MSHPQQRTAKLAIDGGSPVIPDGPPQWPPNEPAVHEALERVWRDRNWGKYHGPSCTELAAKIGERFRVDHVLLCCSGTYAVEAALRGLGIGPGDEVILAGYDFPGNFRAIETIGARPVLVDIDSNNWSMSVEALEQVTRPGVRAVIVSHLHGGLVPMDRVMAWANRHGVAVVEDICQSPAAELEGRIVGTFGDVGVLSFGGSKTLTSGRGGAILTRRADVFQRAKIYGHRGNDVFPLSELQAAVLLPQLDVLDQRNAKRRASVTILLDATKDIAGLSPLSNRIDDVTPVYYKLPWLYSERQFGGRTRHEFIAAVQAEGVAIDSGFRGFAHRGNRRCDLAGDLANSRQAAIETVLLHHPVLLEDEPAIKLAAAAMTKVAKNFCT